MCCIDNLNFLGLEKYTTRLHMKTGAVTPDISLLVASLSHKPTDSKRNSDLCLFQIRKDYGEIGIDVVLTGCQRESQQSQGLSLG